MKAFKTLLALSVWILMGSMSMKGAIITHTLFSWQAGIVLLIVVGFCALTLLAINTPTWLIRSTHEPQTPEGATS